MAAKSGPEFRQFTVALTKTKWFLKLSPTAKATYFVLLAQLESYGVGRCVLETLHVLVNCTPDELNAALDELAWAGQLQRDDAEGIYWLRREGLNLNPSYRTFIQKTLSELPHSSPVVQSATEYLLSKHGVTTVVPQVEVHVQEQEQEQVQEQPQSQGEVERQRDLRPAILKHQHVEEGQQPVRSRPTRNASVHGEEGFNPEYATTAKRSASSSTEEGQEHQSSRGGMPQHVRDELERQRRASAEDAGYVTVPVDDDLPF